ncbi:MAG: hypothetical protein KAV48_07510, partial [Methanomicrobia archaeon]|nr:hypothetical protein [Methanomicrobia archaeon]
MAEDTEFKRRTRTQDIVIQLKKNKTAMVGLAILLVIVILSIGAPIFTTHDPYKINLDYRLKPGFWSDDYIPGYYLGTDALGRD